MSINIDPSSLTMYTRTDNLLRKNTLKFSALEEVIAETKTVRACLWFICLMFVPLQAEGVFGPH